MSPKTVSRASLPMRGAAVLSLAVLATGARAQAPAGAPPSAPSSATAPFSPAMPSRAELMEAFTRASTGNVADAVDEATGVRGFMSGDMKPVFAAKVMGPAVTILMRRVLRTDTRAWPNLQIQALDEAPAGSVLVEVLEDGLDTAGVGNLMATTARVRGLAGMVIDGGARDVEELEQIGFPVWSRSLTPATSVGRYVPVGKNVPVTCGGVPVRPGDWIVADRTGVVVVPQEALPRVVQLLRDYDDKETKMVPLIREHKSMGKALQRYNRY